MRTTTLLILTLSLLGCGRQEASAPLFQRPALRELEPISRADVSVARILPPASEAAASDWSLVAPSTDFEEAGERRSLRLEGGERHYLEIPTELPAGAFNLLRVRLTSAHELSIQSGLLRDGEVLASTGDFAFVRPGEIRELELELIDAAGLTGPPARLAMSVKGKQLEWSLLEIELVQRPLEAWLPAAQQPRGVVLGTEARRAFGLSTRAALAAELLVPRDGRLGFSAAWARKLAPPDRQGRVRVRVAELEGERAEEFELALDEEPGWREQDVSLAGFAGRRVELRFALELTGGRAGTCALSEPVVYAPREQPATVLLVTSDTHRGDHLNPRADGAALVTPTLDALAARGLRFSDCFVTSNITLPSHAALFTGTHPRDTGVIDNSTMLEERAPTLAERFHEAGFLTFGVAGAWHLRPGWSGFDQGLDRMSWPTAKNSVASGKLDALEAWLDQADGRPLFVWLHLFDAHRPYAPPPPFDRLYYPEGRDPFSASLPEPDFPPPPGQLGLRDIDYVHAQYKGEVSYLDAELGRLFERSRFGSAIVALTSDHGESLGQHGIWWNHVGLYPEILHVPLLLSWPDAPAGSVLEGRVRQIDIGRTLLNLAGLKEQPFPGRDLRQSAGADEAARFGLSGEAAEASLNLGRWHLILSLRERSKESDRGPRAFELHRTELYDLEADPGCLVDMASEERARARRLRARLIEWLRDASAGGWGRALESSAADREFLAELGYASGGEADGSELFPDDCRCEHCLQFE